MEFGDRKSEKIYILKCPFSGSVRYVGKGVDLRARYRQHLSESRIGRVKSHKCDWIRSVLRKGGKPILEVDEIVSPGSSWKEAECRRISYYLSLGCNLTNGTTGGDGNGPLTAEGRAILSRRASETFGSPEGRKRQSETMKDLCKNPDFVKMRVEASRLKRSSPEYKAALSEISKARWANPEYRKKMADIRSRLNSDPDFRKKISKGVSAAQSSADFRAMKSAKAKEAWSRPDVRTKQVAAIREASVKKRGS